MAGWRMGERPTNLRTIDPVAFRYLYSQVRRNFDSGLVCCRRERVAGEREQKWWVPIWQSGGRDKKEDRLYELNMHIMQLVGRNMAIDVMDEIRDKKEVLKNVKAYIPKDLWSGLEKIMAVKMLQTNVENYVEKLLKAYQPTQNSMALKEDFLRQTEKFFPGYFCESFPAQFDDGGRVTEVRLVVYPPQEQQQVTLAMASRGEAGTTVTNIATIDQICNIALKDATSIEISHKNGIPLYFCLTSPGDTFSLLTLLCGYYRLAEKWTFSLCTEVRFPILERLLASKVHGPVTKTWAEERLARLKFKKGMYLLRQCTSDHRKVFLNFCSRDGLRPEEVLIVYDKSGYRLEVGGKVLPQELSRCWSTVGELVLAVKNNACFVELGDCLHPSEFDKSPSLFLCRTDSQWREDSLGNKISGGKEKLHIHPRALSRYEASLQEGRMCRVWQGEWRRAGQDSQKVAIKQLNKEKVESHLSAFLSMSHKAMMWDDASLASVSGFCLPFEAEPPVLVTEFFPLGPLPNYLAENKAILQPVDLLEAATGLARALYYLEDNGIVHGEIRARNMFVAQHSEDTFKVKLCEGGLDGPSQDEVHWLDMEQLQQVLQANMVSWVPSPDITHKLKSTLAGDIWSFGTTLWEIFSMGLSPLPGVPTLEAARQYLAGYRLSWRGPAHLASPLYGLMKDCWLPDPRTRKQPQAIMRDINQLLYKVFNSRRVHEYVTIDVGPPSSCPTPATLTPDQQSLALSDVTEQGRGETIDSTSLYTDQIPGSGNLVPMFNDLSRKLETAANMNCFGNNIFGSSSPLLTGTGGSRSGSSLAGSLFSTDMSGISGISQFTCQTSLDYGSSSGGGLYSISSIYQLEDSQIEYSTDNPLGEGNFGVVYRGVRTRSDGDWEQVAIKIIKDTDSMASSAVDDMEREVRLMKQLSHENIVKIRGVLGDGPKTIIVMEYIRDGSLDHYLQVNRHNLDYPKQLFGYSQNIVDGMEYLTDNKIIHRDLAARNILVADHETVKISDFGLARVVTDDCYEMRSTTNIPVKWEAIECLTHRKYSHKSDVWSFGVTLWEMFAFGRTPALAGCEDYFTSYERQRQDYKDWLTKLEEGVRLPRTEFCPNYLYSRVMLACWNSNPASRPSFQQLKLELKRAELEVT